ncbi:putative transmembrane protein [Gregarina niphandrodes]|uniref:Transmembrane protein n=1 Tax=Gregarina niphandrodes TaxID=110365 RepID=A0A023B4G1_GRENI|nr:putative transmembrane protein [Gregarina niphandrodes]EZG56360.1 putative transmembrane protein [Gregarina niphandrodes]|eukprot:XP_011131289.1 putative transmembrane protein [Gregarina niphandrodes]
MQALSSAASPESLKRVIRSGQQELQTLIEHIISLQAELEERAVDRSRLIILEGQLVEIEKLHRLTLESIGMAEQGLLGGGVATATRLTEVSRTLEHRYIKQRGLLQEQLKKKQKAQVFSGGPIDLRPGDAELLNESMVLDLSLQQIDETVSTARSTIGNLRNQGRILSRVRKGTARAIASSMTASYVVDRIRRLESKQRFVLLSVFSCLVFLTLFYLYRFKL